MTTPGGDAPWRDSLAPGGRTSRRLHAVGLSVVVALAAISVGAAAAVDQANHAAQRDRLFHTAERVERYAAERYLAYEEILEGTAALFRASERVTEAEFAEYVRSLDLEAHYPAMHGIGFAVPVADEALEEVERAVASEHPGFAIHPRVRAPLHYVVRFREPAEPNRRVLAFDLASEPRRRAAIEEAARTGLPTLTERVTLLQDPGSGPAFLLFQAVRLPSAAGSAEAGVVGWVYTMFTAKELLEDAPRVAGGNVDLEVSDDPSGRARLLDTDPGTSRSARDRDAVTLPLHLGRRTWSVAVRPGPSFVLASERDEPVVVLVLGLVVTTVTGAFILALLRTRTRAIHLAEGMTRALRDSERELREANARLAQLALEDGLTGTSNRRFFDERLREECARADRTGAALSLVLVDVDHFKAFNDLYGHPEGDACLRAIARALAGSTRRPGDVLARYGGEEFVLLLPGLDVGKAAELAEAARVRIAELVIPHEASRHAKVTASFGVAEWGEGGLARTPEALVNAADAALYVAKDRGRNRVVVAPT